MARDIQQLNDMKHRKPSEDEIAARAYQIFLERGSPEGRDLEHWLEAEAQLSGEILANGSAPQPVKPITALPKAQKASLRQTATRRV
ncbi:MAG: DUF2934 domain-containing protein [Akkermansiaceae bacterium]|nr:DUF2934 domain-containing protein [Verrucomicrobiales bacterium]